MKKRLVSYIILSFAAVICFSAASGILSAVSRTPAPEGDDRDSLKCMATADNALISLAEYELSLRDVISITDRNVISSSLAEMTESKREYEEYAESVGKQLTDRNEKRAFEEITSAYHRFIAKAEELASCSATTDGALSGHYHRVAVKELDPLYEELVMSWNDLRDDISASVRDTHEESSPADTLMTAATVCAVISALLSLSGIAAAIRVSADAPVPEEETKRDSTEKEAITQAAPIPAADPVPISDKLSAVYNCILGSTSSHEYAADPEFAELCAQSREFADRYAAALSAEKCSAEKKAAERKAKIAAACDNSFDSLRNTFSSLSDSICAHSEMTDTALIQAGQQAVLIEEGSKAADSLSRTMTEIKKNNSSISEILRSIQDIAFQTNILAINAAVEAAGAGSAGKGFAVVAEEVRNLASRSSAASQASAELIERSEKAVEIGMRTADSAASGLRKALNRSQLLNETAAKLSEEQGLICESAKKTDSSITEMSEALKNLRSDEI